MNGVLGMMEVLDRQGLDPAQRRTVATMRDSAHALLRIIDDVLDFSKIEAGRLELETTIFSLSGLIDGVMSTFQAQAAAKGLVLTGSIEPGSDDTLVGDPTRVRQILFNLLGNALKFTEHGSVTVRAATTPIGGGRTAVSLTVADTGIGIDEESRKRLFQPFAQADFLDHAPLRRHRARPLDRAPARPADGRRHLGREHARRRLDLPCAAHLRCRAEGRALRGLAAFGRECVAARPAEIAERRAAAGARGRRSSGEPGSAGAPARPARRRGRHRRGRRRGARSLAGAALRGGARRHPHAAHGRLRVRAPPARDRSRAARQSGAHARRRRHGERHEGRGGALPRGRHGRLSGEAGEHRPAARHAGALARDRRDGRRAA